MMFRVQWQYTLGLFSGISKLYTWSTYYIGGVKQVLKVASTKALQPISLKRITKLLQQQPTLNILQAA